MDVPSVEPRSRSHGARRANAHRHPQAETLLLPQLIDVLGTVVEQSCRAVDLDSGRRLLAAPLHPSTRDERRLDRFGGNARDAVGEPKPAEPFDAGDLAMVRCGLQSFSGNPRELARDRIQRVAQAAGMHQKRADADQAQGNEVAHHWPLHETDPGLWVG